MRFCNCPMFCSALLCVHSSFAIISMRERELVTLLYLSSWCLVIVCLQFVTVVHSIFAIIFMGKREEVALLILSSWRLLIVVRLFLKMPQVCLQFVIVVFSDHTQ